MYYLRPEARYAIWWLTSGHTAHSTCRAYNSQPLALSPDFRQVGAFTWKILEFTKRQKQSLNGDSTGGGNRRTSAVPDFEKALDANVALGSADIAHAEIEGFQAKAIPSCVSATESFHETLSWPGPLRLFLNVRTSDLVGRTASKRCMWLHDPSRANLDVKHLALSESLRKSSNNRVQRAMLFYK